ncbi:general stress protein [Pseudalkalibacillus caeni]|uniref:general stress protein n=1 Tax=Exobacillus caeni TaxID=2574798 RepID=UPI001484E503|nr:general stress protein [Pseudalkalibacillus caeni]
MNRKVISTFDKVKDAISTINAVHSDGYSLEHLTIIGKYEDDVKRITEKTDVKGKAVYEGSKPDGMIEKVEQKFSSDHKEKPEDFRQILQENGLGPVKTDEFAPVLEKGKYIVLGEKDYEPSDAQEE